MGLNDRFNPAELIKDVVAGTYAVNQFVAFNSSHGLNVGSNQLVFSSDGTYTMGTLGMVNFRAVATGTTAAKGIKCRALGLAAGTHGDVLGADLQAILQDGTTAANTTIAGMIAWADLSSGSNTIGNGNIVAGVRSILQSGQDLTSLGGGGQSAVFYGNVWGTANNKVNAGIWIANSATDASNPTMECVLGASSAAANAKSNYAFDFSDLNFMAAGSLMRLPDDNNVADDDATQAITGGGDDNFTTAGYIKVHVAGSVRYIWLASNAPT
jgi:hypothetical protein